MGTRYRGTPEEIRALNAFINLIRASSSLEVRINRHLQEVPLTPGQFGVLEVLFHCGSLCQSDLGGKLLTSGPNITLVVDNLEKRGLAQRERSKEDRRFVSVKLTDQGRALVQKIFPKHARIIAEQFTVLSVRDQEELRRLCRKLGKGRDGS